MFIIKLLLTCIVALLSLYFFIDTSNWSTKITSFNNYENVTVSYKNITINQVNQTNKIPLILTATTFMNKSMIGSKWFKIDQECPFQCTYSDDFSLYNDADVAVFYSRAFHYSDRYLAARNPSRLNAFFVMESEANEDIRTRYKGMPLDFFNITLSYQRDSTIWVPYDRFERIKNQNSNEIWTDEQVEEKLKIKKKLMLQFVSHCDTHSKREKLTHEMKNHANVTQYGGCNKKLCDKESEEKEIDEHFFYLAFENSVCQDYASEKFWRIKKLIVPVVLKRSILKGIVEDEYFIAVDDYKNLDEFINHLKYLSTHLDEYKKYLRWTKKYKKNYAKPTVSCQLCELAHQKKQNFIPNIIDWWHKPCKCYKKYSLNVFFCKSYPFICNLRSSCPIESS